MAKLKMKNKKFAAIVGPLSVVALAVGIALPILGNMFSTTIDTFMGKGELHVVKAEGSENWDTDYYTKKYDKAEDARKNGMEASEKISDGGIVLLRNENSTLPLAKNSKVTPFGYGYSTPTYGGSGSGNVDTSKDFIVSPAKALASKFDVVTAVADITADAKNAEAVKEASGTKAADQGSGMFVNNFSLYGIPTSKYDSVKSSITNTNAVVFIARGGGESNDIKNDGYTDGTKHNLQLSQNEKDTIKYAKDNGASKVIAIINSSNVMELGVLTSGDYAVDAILWVGGPGANGFSSMAKVMCGEVNPSGRTVDIYPSNLLDMPSVKNFGDYAYTNATYNFSGTDDPAHFVEYEEGIYNGYRYYETMDSLEGGDWYKNNVVYPFGAGLSYSTFEQTIVDHKVENNKIVVTVKVENKSKADGKEVVQIYYNAPYTDENKTDKVEKATKNLVQFKKVEVKAESSETFDVEFEIEDMASYNYNYVDADGVKGAYQLDEGDYTIYLGKNSHDSWGNFTYHQNKKVVYDSDNARQSEIDGQSVLNDDGTIGDVLETQYYGDANSKAVAATNQFQELSDYMNESGIDMMSRATGHLSNVTAPTANDVHNDSIKSYYNGVTAVPGKELPAKYLANFNAEKAGGYDYKTNPETGNVEGSKVYNNTESKYVDSGYTLSQMRGKSYYDEEWNTLMDQINFSDSDTIGQLRDLFYYAAYNTAEVSSIGKVATQDFDGPQGISSFIVQNLDCCAYCSEVVVASTWDVDLVKLYGEAIGQEGLTNGIQGWYGPAMNNHRTPFSGRNFEYYSEDGLLAGKIAASVISGAADQGFYAYMKHFALNDQETNRTLHICTWATEQAVREIYLKPFEICAKEARQTIKYTADSQGTVKTKTIRGCSAVMSSFNSIGTTMAASNYGLLTQVLRNEWGFQGFVESDFGPYVNYDDMIRSGGDVLLNSNWGGAKMSLDQVFGDITSNTAKNVMKNAIKNVCYTQVNSAAFNGIAPGSTSYRDIAPWRILLYVVMGVMYALTATGVGFITFRFLDEKKHPDKYAK